MIFRDYESTDYPQLISLWEELDLSSPERCDTKDIVEQTINMGAKLLVMIDSNKMLLGSSWMTFDGRRIFLHHFGIRKSQQGKGYGTLLAQESLKFIKEKNYQVKLEVHKDNIEAKHLYEKLGFFAFTDYDIYMIRDVDNIKTT